MTCISRRTRSIGLTFFSKKQLKNFYSAEGFCKVLLVVHLDEESCIITILLESRSLNLEYLLVKFLGRPGPSNPGQSDEMLRKKESH